MFKRIACPVLNKTTPEEIDLLRVDLATSRAEVSLKQLVIDNVSDLLFEIKKRMILSEKFCCIKTRDLQLKLDKKPEDLSDKLVAANTEIAKLTLRLFLKLRLELLNFYIMS